MLRRDVVGVEYRHKLRVAVGQAVVQVAGFGVGIVATREIAAAKFLRKRLHLWPVAVVQQKCLMRIVHPDGGGDRLADNRQRFVVHGDEDVNRQACFRRRRFPQHRPRGGEYHQ